MNALYVEKPEGKTCRIVFVRHGQTDWNTENRFRGRADVPLNHEGRLQAAKASVYLREVRFAAAYSSPLQRTRETAEQIGRSHGIVITPRDELCDIDYGEWTGKRPSEIDPDDARLWKTNPEMVEIPWGETMQMVTQRLLRFARELRYHSGEIVLVVAHDIIGRVLLCLACGAPIASAQRFRQDNACVDVVDLGPDELSILRANDTSHLGPD